MRRELFLVWMLAGVLLCGGGLLGEAAFAEEPGVLTAHVPLGKAIRQDEIRELREIRPGVRLLTIEKTEPRLMKIKIMRVDLTLPGLAFTGTGRAEHWGEPMPDYTAREIPIRTLREETRQFMKNARKNGRKMIVAADTTPWAPWEAPWNHKYGHPAGLVISEGVVVTDDGNPNHPMIVVWKDGRIEITGEIDPAKKDDIWMAHTGFGITMKDGVEVDGGGYEHGLMPRMTYGLSKDKRYLYLLTCDGRQEGWSLGATGPEISAIMKTVGAWDVVDMDGGGSASLCYWDEANGEPVMVNRHSANGATRRVATNFGIYLE